MSTFRKPYTIYRKAEGSYVKGVWTDGAETETTILASFQPMGSDEIVNLNVGRKEVGKIKGYTSTKLQITDVETQVAGDVVLYNGRRYELIAEDVNQSGVISHYKYIGEYRE